MRKTSMHYLYLICDANGYMATIFTKQKYAKDYFRRMKQNIGDTNTYFLHKMVLADDFSSVNGNDYPRYYFSSCVEVK